MVGCVTFFEGISREGWEADDLLRPLEENGLMIIRVKDFGEDYGPPILRTDDRILVGLAEIDDFCRQYESVQGGD